MAGAFNRLFHPEPGELVAPGRPFGQQHDLRAGSKGSLKADRVLLTQVPLGRCDHLGRLGGLSGIIDDEERESLWREVSLAADDALRAGAEPAFESRRFIM